MALATPAAFAVWEDVHASDKRAKLLSIARLHPSDGQTGGWLLSRADRYRDALVWTGLAEFGLVGYAKSPTYDC
jgi:hypothetical protein